MEAEKMDRGTDALKAHLGPSKELEIRQTRRGWFQELLGCEARTEMKYFVDGNQIAQSLEDSDCLCRLCCLPCYPFTVAVRELNTEAELLTGERPFRCAPGGCKCCCYQEMKVSSGGTTLGTIKETFYFCVPMYKVYDDKEKPIYKVHPPTCCAGCCVNCCTEGNPCFGRGCCKVPFWVFPADQEKTDGDVEHIGKILKEPKSLVVEVFTDADVFNVTFPDNASTEEKALLTGTALFLNVLHFEANSDQQGGN